MVTGEYPPQLGGVGDATARLSEALAADGVEVTVATNRNLSATEGGIPALRVIPDWGPGCWPRLASLARSIGADVVHVQYQAGAFELKGAIHLLPLYLRLAGRRARGDGWRPRVVTTFHDLRVPYLFAKAGPLRRAAVGWLLAGSHAAIFTDPGDLTTVGGRPGRHWVPIGTNIVPPRLGQIESLSVHRLRAMRTPDDGLVVGFFGFFGPDKGLDTLLRALRLLLDDGRRAHLVLIGAETGAHNPTDRPTAAAFWREVLGLGLEAHVHPTGPLEAAAVSDHLLACDVIALPYRDGASFRRGTLMAALAHSRPIVTTTPEWTAVRSRPWHLEPERHFLAVPPDDAPALARAILRLADASALAAELGAHAGALADQLTWPAIARLTRGVYDELTANL